MRTSKTFCLSALFVALIGPANITKTNAFTGETDGQIIVAEDYVFPTYEKASKIRGFKRNTSKNEYEQAVGDKRFEFKKLTYLSDGLKVKAYLYQPKNLGHEKYPAIIFNRGGYIRGDIAPEVISMFHRLAREGFVVLAPMYRQSDGGEGRDLLGGEDVNDMINTLPLAVNLKFIDTNNLFMYGESRGGMMTYQAIKRGFPMKASAVFGAFTDMDKLFKFRPDVYTPQLGKMIFGTGFESKKEEIVRTRSVINWIDKFSSPILIMHGGNDQSVNPEQSLTFAQMLTARKKVYELVVYAGDNHVLSTNRLNRDRRVIAWFRKNINRK